MAVRKSNTTPWMGPSGTAGTTKQVNQPIKTPSGGTYSMGPRGLMELPSLAQLQTPKAPAPLPNAQRSSGGGSVNGGSTGRSYSAVEPSFTGAMQAVEEPPPPPKPQTFDDWKAQGGNVGDSTWGAETASAQSEYEGLLASLAQQNTGFLNDWRGGLKSMGWQFGADGDRSGNWNADDTIGAYGQTRNNLVNDFAGRGLMDSTFYQEGMQNMDRRFNQQRDDMLRSYDNSQNEYTTNQANAVKSKESAQQRALADAYARYTSGFGL